MYVPAGFSTISRLAGAVATIWLCCTGPAWAGDGGGGSVESSQGFLGAAPNGSGPGLCHLLGMTSCPQLPTLTQLVLQFSALQNAPPDTVRGPFGPPTNLLVAVGGLGSNGPNCSVAGTQGLPPCNQTAAITSINPPLSSRAPPTLPLDPSSLALELGFSGVSLQGTAVPVPAGGTPSSYFTAVTSAEAGGQLDTLNLYYQYRLATTTFPKNQQVAAVSFPLAILDSDGTERSIIATLQLNATSTCAGVTSCITPTVLGNFSGNATQKVSPNSLGVTWVLTLPNSAPGLATLRVQVPLLVTLANDEAYFGVVPSNATVVNSLGQIVPNPKIGSPTNPPFNQVSGILTAFDASIGDVVNAVTFIKGATGAGIPPYAAPAVPLGTAVSSLTTWSYGFCASFWESSTATKTLTPAVAAFGSIGTDGTAYASSPIAAQGLTLTCPF